MKNRRRISLLLAALLALALVPRGARAAELEIEPVEGTGGDFIRGMDISSLYANLNSGAEYRDFQGNILEGPEILELLADCGVNWVRLRVWNDPFDSRGRGYGGGNCDIQTAAILGKWATDAGMRVLIDFHYSDFWADPGKQQAPKAWAGYGLDRKAAALGDFTARSLELLADAGVDVAMVQLGNETTGGFCGETRWESMAKLFSAGAAAVRAADPEIRVALHFTDPQKGNYGYYGEQLELYAVDYDVFASSYYPYWHGTPENLIRELKYVADTFGKEVLVAETAWAHTLEDGDGHPNTVSVHSNSAGMPYPFTVQGQGEAVAAAARAVRDVGDAGLGLFYWEPAWIPVRVWDGTDQSLRENRQLWERYGSGWASSAAGEYDSKDAGLWYGGSAVDNQALFAFDGTPLESLKVFRRIQPEAESSHFLPILAAAAAGLLILLLRPKNRGRANPH